MSFSPGWCYQPGLKGRRLYISGSVLFIFDLASIAQPRLAAPSAVVELVLPRRRRRLPPPGRAILPARIAPHPVSAAAPDPTLRRRGFPRAHRRRTRSLLRSRSAAVVEPRPPGLVYRRRAPPARPRRRTRPPARPAVVDYNVGFFIVFLDNTNKQYLVVI